ncbi:hypothetical protein NDU88_001245 [Pleurodeles waltl]|uniref:Uncharacterized protein n=1 Tax=Pleurodeles waltl TaxID=8319 RepID=A0AAV7WL78_PLEWA|nr:hypothetical protein NDU88_001245 [Pleurodeles waltl]
MLRSPSSPRVTTGAAVGSQRHPSFARATASVRQAFSSALVAAVRGGPAPGNKGTRPPTPTDDGDRHRAIPRCHAPQWTINGYPGLPRTQRVSSLASGGSRAAITDASVSCGREAPGPAPRVGGRLFAGRRPHPALRFAPSLQGGPVTGFGAGRCAPPGSGPRPQSADNFPGLGPRRGARVLWGPPLGQRPCASGPARDSRSPTPLLRLGEPPGSARSGPTYRQGRSLLAAPSSSSRPCARSGGETATPLSPRPQRSCHSSLSAIPPASARPGTRL